jgi:hypothetical protein
MQDQSRLEAYKPCAWLTWGWIPSRRGPGGFHMGMEPLFTPRLPHGRRSTVEKERIRCSCSGVLALFRRAGYRMWIMGLLDAGEIFPRGDLAQGHAFGGWFPGYSGLTRKNLVDVGPASSIRPWRYKTCKYQKPSKQGLDLKLLTSWIEGELVVKPEVGLWLGMNRNEPGR